MLRVLLNLILTGPSCRHRRAIVQLLCALAAFVAIPQRNTTPVTADADRSSGTLLDRWHFPTLPFPARPDAVGWKDRATTGGYRLQHNTIAHTWRALDRANVPIAVGGRGYCEHAIERELAEGTKKDRPNLALPTLGGYQLWGDEMIYCGWRIQRNVVYGHHRLLDPDDVRRAWGSYDECRAAFDRLVDRDRVQPRSDEFVLLVHGLLEMRPVFANMRDDLTSAGYEVVEVRYPSTQASIPKFAAQLHRIITRMEGAHTIHFVTHSLGGLIVRYYLDEYESPVQIGRMVMIGTPNQGAIMAQMLKDWFPFEVIAGPAGQQLVGGSDSLIALLPAPSNEFAIIAGGRGDDRGFSPLIPGDDDGIVSVESTRLEGMADFLRVPVIHHFLPGDARVIRATVQFLERGSFAPDAP